MLYFSYKTEYFSYPLVSFKICERVNMEKKTMGTQWSMQVGGLIFMIYPDLC